MTTNARCSRLATAIILTGVIANAAQAQDVPQGVRYKRASPETNAQFIKNMTRMLTGTQPEAERAKLLGAAVVCGPKLWSLLEKKPDPLLESGNPATLINPDTGEKLAAKFFKSDDKKIEFLRRLHELVDPKVELKFRIPSRKEIGDYWAIIAWDIEEPLVVLDLGDKSLLINGDDDGRVFYIDLIAGK